MNKAEIKDKELLEKINLTWYGGSGIMGVEMKINWRTYGRT